MNPKPFGILDNVPINSTIWPGILLFDFCSCCPSGLNAPHTLDKTNFLKSIKNILTNYYPWEVSGKVTENKIMRTSCLKIY